MFKFKANYIISLSILISLCNCEFNKKEASNSPGVPNVVATSAMKNVMWKGELFGKIQLDTLSKKGLYGLGPQHKLQGEILINDGVVYVSKVLDSTQIVVKTDNVEAPFFVHSYVFDWHTENLPKSIKSIKDLENYIKTKTAHINTPFAFKLEGTVDAAQIHIQNLPSGTKVSSPKEAHQGQVNYSLKNEFVTIIGFYSENHQGVFTHHDSFLHMHLITKDEKKMGHLDVMTIDNLKLSLPKGVVE